MKAGSRLHLTRYSLVVAMPVFALISYSPRHRVAVEVIGFKVLAVEHFRVESVNQIEPVEASVREVQITVGIDESTVCFSS